MSLFFHDIVGNEQTITGLKVAAISAKERNTSVGHILFGGPPGTGKSMTSRALAEFLESPFIQIDPASIKSGRDLLEVVREFPRDGYDENGKIVGEIKCPILFLDEIHQISLKGSEVLGICMEDFILPAEIKKRKRNFWVPRFTIVGATTLTGKLPKPLRDRFKLQYKFETYSDAESFKIVCVQANYLGIKIEPLAAMLVARRGRGVARTLVRFLEIARDHMVVHKKSIVDEETVLAMFQFMDIDMDGLTKLDRKILECLYKCEEPVGLDSLSVLLNEAQDTIAKEIEPYLIIKGLIQRTPKGRILTEAGEKYIS